MFDWGLLSPDFLFTYAFNACFFQFTVLQHLPSSAQLCSSFMGLFSLPQFICGFLTFIAFFQYSVQFSSVQSLSRVRLFVTPWIAARQASLSITNSRSSLKLMCIESVMPSSHLILCRPLLLLPPMPPSIRVFSNESTLRMRWPKYWSFSLSISPSNEHAGLVSFQYYSATKRMK